VSELTRNPIWYLRIARALAADGDLPGARAKFERALELSPQLVAAHLGYAEMLTRHGDVAAALEHIAAGYKPTPGVTVPYTGSGTPIRVLQLGSAIAGGHVNTDAFLDAVRFEVTTIVVEYWDRTRPFPPHDIVVNSIADADLCDSSLYVAEWLLEGDTAPVINPPARVRATGRAANSEYLRNLGDVVVPHIELLPKEALLAPVGVEMLLEHGFTFPLLARSPGHHNGRHFEKVDAPEALRVAIAALPGDDILVIEFIDVREHDDTIRKYRAVLIDGKLYPAHLAVSDAWKIHYFSAKMGDAERAEEARYFENPRAALGDKVVDGLESVAKTLGLEYLGIDFGIDSQGLPVIFEANASMTIFLPEDDEASRYRRAPVLAIYNAAREMIANKAASL
jgi:glutathione synthase/RimK-type ligase-like ATP-grasp enzyme